MSRNREILGVRSDELAIALSVASTFLITQMSHAFSANAADALFFTRFGVESLPIMIAASGVVTMVVLVGHSVGLGRHGSTRWLPLMLIGSAAIAMAEWALSIGGWRPVYPVIWVLTQATIWLTFTVMWNGAGSTADTRQAKRLFPLYASAGVAGAIVGNLLTGPIADVAGTESLLALQFALLTTAAILMWKTARYFNEPESPDTSSALEAVKSAARTVSSTPLIRLVAIVSFALWALFFLVVFPFNEAVAAAYESDAEIAGFLGLFASAATGATFLVSLVGARALFARIGIVTSLFLVPVVYVIGFAVWLVSFDLSTAAAVRGVQWVAVNAIGGTAIISLFNVVPGRRRGQVTAFVTAVPAQIGIVAGGLILLVGPAVGNGPLFVVGLAMAAITALVVFTMKHAYVEALLSAVRGGLVGIFRTPHEHVTAPVGRETLRLLTEHLRADSPDERLVAIAALEASQMPEMADLVAPLLDDSEPRVRLSAFTTLSNSEAFVRAHLENMLDDDWPPVRRRALDASAVLGTGLQAEIAGRLIDDHDPSVRAEAAWVLGGPSGQAVLEQLLASQEPAALLAALSGKRHGSVIHIDYGAFVAHDHSGVRAAAVSNLGDDDDGLRKLRQALADPAIAVRRAAADRLTELPAGREILREALHTGSVNETDIALRTLDPTDLIDEDLLNWARTETERASVLAGYRKALGSIPETPAIAYLKEVLLTRSKTISDWVLLALRRPETATELALIERGIWSEDASTRAQAFEALDALGDHSVTGPLLTLLEAAESREPVGQADVLQRLADDFDPWLRDLSIRASEECRSADLGTNGHTTPLLADSEGMTTHSAELLDKMIALHRVEMFGGLDPEDLELVAAAAEEQSFVSGELIYAEHDPADEMLVLVDGDAVVTTRHDGPERMVAVYGAGQHVGELALLQKATRSADVHAGERGATALTIRDSDLQSILEERPAVAIAMLKTLAARLAEQT